VNPPIEVGRVLAASTTSFVVGCRVGRIDIPALGALVHAPVQADLGIYGLVTEIRIADDGLVRQLVTADAITDEVIRDNRERRIVPVEISVLAVGHEVGGRVLHRLPPRPPLSLDVIYLCDEGQMGRFTAGDRFEYFRHILRAADHPVGEIIAAHILQVRGAHRDPNAWTAAAVHEVITLLRDDYPLLTSVLGAVDAISAPVSGKELDK